MIRKIISIIIYVFAGFFFFSVDSVLFIDNKQHIPCYFKLGIAGFFFVLGLILFFIGILFSGLKNWRRDLGVLFITVTAIELFTIMTFICIYLTPELQAMMPKNVYLYSQSSLLQRISYIIFTGAVGVLLLLRYKQKIS